MDPELLTESIEVIPKIAPEIVPEIPKVVPKRTLSVKQLDSLKKARESKASKKNLKPLITPQEINMNYMILTGSMGLASLLVYYYMKRQKVSRDTSQDASPIQMETIYNPREQNISSLDSFY